MSWQKTRPTVATAKEAGFSTLDQWNRQLPDPQTDAEKAVHRKNYGSNALGLVRKN